jgi:hypothetical protein
VVTRLRIPFHSIHKRSTWVFGQSADALRSAQGPSRISRPSGPTGIRFSPVLPRAWVCAECWGPGRPIFREQPAHTVYEVLRRSVRRPTERGSPQRIFALN